MTVGVPGNTPYIITVGAMSDRLTNNPNDDFLASFSSAGPTFEGFVKPEILAPGGHVLGLMSPTSTIAQTHPEFHDGGNYFFMSGTSQSAAIVLEGVRRFGVALYLTSITFGLATIAHVLRFQTIRLRELA